MDTMCIDCKDKRLIHKLCVTEKAIKKEYDAYEERDQSVIYHPLYLNST